MGELNDRLVGELIDAVRQVLRKESTDRLRDVYLIGDIEKDTARACIERLRELANEANRPITLYINRAGGNDTDDLAIHDAVRHIVIHYDQIISRERPEHQNFASQESPSQQASVPHPTAGSRQSTVD